MLLAGWLQQVRENGLRPCWLSLDEGDNDQAGFWIYVLAALQTVTGAWLGEATRAAFQSPQPPRIETVLISLINDLAAVNGHIILVLDDYHTITAPEISAALDFFIERVPPNLHLVIASRENPRLSLSRLRARGQLAEIRAADLRFSTTETGEFFGGPFGLDLAQEDIDALVERTEGWITGLHLAGLSLQNEADPHSFIGAFTASHRFLTDYLVDEVLSRQETALRHFLLHTSFLRRLNPELCDYVLQACTSQQMLRHLDEVNLFLVPLDNERRWYRYHHLFAQFLLLRLRELESQHIIALYQRAMEWCNRQGLQREALGYALEAKFYEEAAQLMEILAPAIISAEGPTQVLQWEKAIPAQVIQRRPNLCVNIAWAYASVGKTIEALAYLNTAEILAAQMPADEAFKITGYIAAHQSYLQFFQGKYEETVRYGKQALARLPESDPVMRARAAVFLGNGLRYAGNFQGAEEALALGESLAQVTRNVYIANMCFASLAELFTERGQLVQTISCFQRALDFNRRYAGRPDIPFAGFAHVGIGRTEREWNHQETAVAYLTRGVELCRESYQVEMLALSLMEYSRLHCDLGQYSQAREDLSEARRITEETSSDWGVATVDAFLARVDLAEGDLDAACHWAEKRGLSPHSEWHFERGVEYETLWRLLILQEKYSDALLVLNRLHTHYQQAGRFGRLIEVLAWQARTYAGLGDMPRAVEVLQEALITGEPGGYLHTFIEAGQPLAEVFSHLPASPYRDRLLDSFHHAAQPTLAATPAALPQQEKLRPPTSKAKNMPEGDGSLVEPLIEREMEVLRLLAAGRSNTEIGAELYLSVNTIRWYASQIYQKLGVGSRGAAVARARELGIIH